MRFETYHGLDMEARFKTAGEKIRAATSFSEVFTAIGAALDPLDDSHTFFIPPRRSVSR